MAVVREAVRDPESTPAGRLPGPVWLKRAIVVALLVGAVVLDFVI